jgi:hypothetical protein
MTIGAEIGCYEGKTTKNVLRNCLRFILIAVDKWENIEPDPNGEKIGCEDWDAEKGYKIFRYNTDRFRKRRKVLRGDSVEMAQHVADNSLDIVFIDADHRYKAVKGDIVAWTPKLKPGGILSGHDIHFPGVLQAVEEMTERYTNTGVNEVWFCKKERGCEKCGLM